jgi:hypothetical protein
MQVRLFGLSGDDIRIDQNLHEKLREQTDLTTPKMRRTGDGKADKDRQDSRPDLWRHFVTAGS